MININFTTKKYPIFSYNTSHRPINRLITDSLILGKKLDRSSVASRFFGVDSRYNVSVKLENHIKLALHKGQDSGIIPFFPKRAFFAVNKPKTLSNAWNHIWGNKRKFDQLLEKPARLTFDGKFFGENGDEGSHTIGILYDKKSKTLFCLDSLSNLCKQVRKYQEILKKQIFNSPNGEIEKIIFSNKHQQNPNEYTCNNWTIANIETLQKALKDGKKIYTTKDLNDVLPNNINSILNEQYKYLLNNT